MISLKKKREAYHFLEDVEAVIASSNNVTALESLKIILCSEGFFHLQSKTLASFSLYLMVDL